MVKIIRVIGQVEMRKWRLRKKLIIFRGGDLDEKIVWKI